MRHVNNKQKGSSNVWIKSYYPPNNKSGCSGVLTEMIIRICIFEIIFFPDATWTANAFSAKVKVLVSGFACRAVYSWNVLGIRNFPCRHLIHCWFWTLNFILRVLTVSLNRTLWAFTFINVCRCIRNYKIRAFFKSDISVSRFIEPLSSVDISLPLFMLSPN